MRAIHNRRSARVAVTCFVNTLDQITSLLKFNRKKVSRRGVNALRVDARRFRRTVVDIVGPKIPAALIRFAIEKIQVVELHEEPGRVDGIRSVSDIIVSEGYGCRCGRAQRCARWIAAILWT